jgi:hypothetical protein
MRRIEVSEPSVTDALADVVHAGQRLMADRVELALVEARGLLEQSVARAALVIVGALVLAGALFALDAALVDLVARFAPRPVAFLSCALVNGALGGSLILAGLRRKAQP